MRSFFLGLIAAVVLAAVSGIVLNALSVSSAGDFSTGETRL